MKDSSPIPQVVNTGTDRRWKIEDGRTSILDPARSPRGRDRRYYVSAWPGLKPEHLLARADIAVPFPFNAVRRSYFYVARNAIYHLFRALRLARNETVLVPDYHSGNEVGAIRAAGASIRHYGVGTALSLLKRSAGRFLTAAQVSRTPVGDIGFDIGRVNIGMSPLCHRLLKNFDYEWIVKRRRENFQLMLRKLSGRASLLL